MENNYELVYSTETPIRPCIWCGKELEKSQFDNYGMCNKCRQEELEMEMIMICGDLYNIEE